VLKYIYSVMEPQRFDVIVFKEPMKAQDNFIKRLIGLPEETIEIIGGDIFVAPPHKDGVADRVIARKPARIQKQLWQLVYNNDFYPLDELSGRWRNPWRGAGDTAQAWYPPNSGKFGSIGGPEAHYRGDGPGTLEFVNRDPYTYNILGYNND